jgi:hypothetical protein
VNIHHRHRPIPSKTKVPTVVCSALLHDFESECKKVCESSFETGKR